MVRYLPRKQRSQKCGVGSSPTHVVKGKVAMSDGKKEVNKEEVAMSDDKKEMTKEEVEQDFKNQMFDIFKEKIPDTHIDEDGFLVVPIRKRKPKHE